MDLKLLPNNAMTFTENQHGNAVLEKLRQQRELVRCCDMILYVNKKKFYAHRCVLSACSPYFDSVLKVNKTVKEQLDIRAHSSEVFHSLLAYMYTGTVIVDKMNVAELLRLANKFLMSKLKEYCAEYLQRYLDIYNCLTVLEMANKYGLESLQKTVNSFIYTHISGIIGGEEILELPMQRLESFIKNPNWCLSNEEILMLVISWVHRKLESREPNFRTLLTWISWNNIIPEKVIEIIQEHRLFSSSRKCHSFILEVLDENGLLCQSEYERLTSNLSTRIDENGLGPDEDSEKLFNLAISTAIEETFLNEPIVDKYLMDTDRELLRSEFPSTDHISFDPRDLSQTLGQNKISNSELHSYLYSCSSQNNSNENNSVTDITNFQTNSYNSQSLEIDQLYKYGIENLPKQKQSLIKSLTDEQILSTKIIDYENIPQIESQNCYHYRDFRETDHLLNQNSDKCPKLTNKVAYMNHKYDANCSNQLSLNDLNYPKILQASDMFSTFGVSQKKDNGNILSLPNSSNEYFMNQVKQDSQYQRATSGNSQKKYQTTLDTLPSHSDIHSALLDNTVNLNSLPEFKSGPFVFGSVHPQILDDVDCPDNLHSPSSLPQDMSLSHLKLCEGDGFASLESGKNKDYLCFENETTDQREDCNSASIIRNETQDYNTSFAAKGVVVEEDATIGKTGMHAYEDSMDPRGEKEDGDATLLDKEVGETPTGQTEDVSSNADETSPARLVKEKEQRDASLPQKATTEGASSKDVSSQLTEDDSTSNANKKRGKRANTRRRETLKKSQKKKPEKSAKVEKKITQKNNNVLKETRACDICKSTFDKKKLYFSHMLTHFAGPPFECDTCMLTFKRIYYLLDHRHTHSEQKPFKCTQCTFTSRRLFNLKEHMILHTKERPFKCKECGDTFRREHHLLIHSTKHSNDKPYICKKCGWHGKTKNILLSHSKIHTGDLYSCKYESCAYRTPKKSHLKEHMQYHSKSRPFACKICSSTFISKYHLKRHSRIHDSPNMCQCPYCDYCSSRQDGMKIHIERRHSMTKPKLRQRKGQLKKKDALLSKELEKKDDRPNAPPLPASSVPAPPPLRNEQAMFSTLQSSGCHLSPNSTLPSLSASLPPCPNAASPPSSCHFETSADPDDPMAIVSQIEDDGHSLSSFHHGPYLPPFITHPFSGILDGPCGSGSRFLFPSGESLL